LYYHENNQNTFISSEGVRGMKYRSIGYLALLCAMLLVSAATADNIRSGPSGSRALGIDKITSGYYSSPIYSTLQNYYQSNAGQPQEVSITFDFNSDVLADSWYNEYLAQSITCTDCGSTQWSHAQGSKTYRYFYSYPHGTSTYYPSDSDTATRGYGSLIVTGPDDANTYYLWYKSKFFATDIQPGYNMQWNYGGILPVNYEDNILEGTYSLKVTNNPYNAFDGVIWCGTAVVRENMTTTVTAIPAMCPFGTC
jgi:hypothetical protein